MIQFDKPTLVTISGPSACGKTFLRDALLREYDWAAVVSTTTRSRRADELFGQDYYFIDAGEFTRLESQGKFIEVCEFNGEKYGVTSTELYQILGNRSSPKVPVLILEPAGVARYREFCQRSDLGIFCIFVQTPATTRLTRLIERAKLNLVEEFLTVKPIKKEELEGFITKTLRSFYNRISGQEGSWIDAQPWDLVVSGDNIEEALRQIKYKITFNSTTTVVKPINSENFFPELENG